MELRDALLKAKQEYQRVIDAGDFSDETLEKEAMTDGICYWLNEHIWHVKKEFGDFFHSQYPDRYWYAQSPCRETEERRKPLLEARIELIDKLLPLI
jgi:hypothetical protein